MARLESEAKGGFYPTPVSEMELILKRITTQTHGNISILDPCAGTGTAINQMKNHFDDSDKVSTYGIELEKSRAAEAKNHVDHFLACGYEDTRMSHDSFSLLYLNPPFMQIKSERAEVQFFRNLTQPNSYLSDSALVILNVPQYTLKDLAKLISSRLEEVRVYRFTDENYDTYKQVIIYGYRKKTKTTNEQLEDYLINLSFSGPASIPSLDTPDWSNVCYKVIPQNKPTLLFTSTIVSIEDILQSESEIHFMDKVYSMVEDVRFQNDHIRNPAMPLKITHQVQAIQSGALPEYMGDHLLVAKDESHQSKRVEYDPETRKSRLIENFTRKSIIRVFKSDGHIDLK
ncbi:SAM-dependent DNA methyltransferase [Paenibacillus taichungensis]|uniref:SAM-dependent DNA methyltransferase n=1 Tax=Paenibacillus taichungensis TaxID=484184 RepID=A0ABX2MIG2_9BACL|nr:DUF6094 domain-containing protein [Paenibacillus taichungensis]NUU53008.1 SAM-dependent DNA methyltransferase [Paenibacillus taichungensis]